MKEKVKDTLQDITHLTSDYCNRNTLVNFLNGKIITDRTPLQAALVKGWVYLQDLLVFQ